MTFTKLLSLLLNKNSTIPRVSFCCVLFSSPHDSEIGKTILIHSFSWNPVNSTALLVTLHFEQASEHILSFSKCTFYPWQVRPNCGVFELPWRDFISRQKRNSDTWWQGPCPSYDFSHWVDINTSLVWDTKCSSLLGSFHQTDKYTGSGSVTKAKRYQIIKSIDTKSYICAAGVTTHTVIKQFLTINIYLLARKYYKI